MPTKMDSTLQLIAYTKIREKILLSELIPGQKISQKSLEQLLHIGRTPVREAILRLDREGLLNIIPQSGTYVSKINMHSVINARFVRENIEKIIISESSSRISDDFLVQFSNIIASQEYFSKIKDHANFFEADDEFHHLFYTICDKNDIWNWLQILNIQLNRFRWMRLKVDELQWNTLIKQHKNILNAVANHDPDEAGFLVSKHLHLMLDERDVLIKSFPDYFVE